MVFKKVQKTIVTTDKKQVAEEEILNEQKIVNYDTREYPVEVIVQKYVEGKEDDENELFVPNYQREFTWDKKRRSKFVESVMLGLPIPYIFTADRGERFEIVDGSQRIRTLADFLNNKLTLEGLEKLKSLNGLTYGDLILSRQRRFNRKTLRMIELTEKADANVRRDIFERINTGSDILKDMEVRKGVFAGPFYDFISECAKNEKFLKLCPISKIRADREEVGELILRFFAYSENYLKFEHRVNTFLDNYIKEKKAHFESDALQQNFENMLDFVEKYFPYGFKKSEKATTTPRVRFEAISVGVHLALQKKPDLVPPEIDWLDSEEFKVHTRSDGSNSRPKVKARIEFVRDKLLDKK
ncbi:DUF262 domain-containing protein [Candidatus Halobeggiatoa sp. HSG11]|nr:DUF262 domain-containing protein [Candidatus Halobeggiatoa sp. HSG11]